MKTWAARSAVLLGLVALSSPLDPAAMLRTAADAVDRKEYEAAERIYERTATHFPHASVIWQNLALVQKLSGELRRSLHSYERAVRLAPVDAGLLTGLGLAACSAQQFGRCMSAFARSAGIEPRRPGTYIAVGNAAAANLGNSDLALRAYKCAQRLSPQEPSLSFNIGIQLLHRLEYDKAAAAFARSATSRHSPAPLRAQALAMLAVAMQRACDWDGRASVSSALVEMMGIALSRGEAALSPLHAQELAEIGPEQQRLIGTASAARACSQPHRTELRAACECS